MFGYNSSSNKSFTLSNVEGKNQSKLLLIFNKISTKVSIFIVNKQEFHFLVKSMYNSLIAEAMLNNDIPDLKNRIEFKDQVELLFSKLYMETRIDLVPDDTVDSISNLDAV